MNEFDKYPKSIKKTIRYIKQDASIQQLEAIKNLIEYAIKKRMMSLNNRSRGGFYDL